MARFYGANAGAYGGLRLGGSFGGGGGVTPLAPGDIAGLTVFADASQIAGKNDGDTITSWSDLSGGGFHFTQATNVIFEPTYQTNEMNSLPVVRFSGDNDFLDSSYSNADQTITVFVVGRFAGVQPVANGRMVCFAEGGGLYHNATGPQFGYFPNQAGTATALGGTVTDINVAVLRYNSASSLDVRFNGGAWTNLNPGDGYFGNQILKLGASGVFGAEAAACDIGTVGLYASALSDATVEGLEAHLAAKWGAVLA